MNRHLEGDEPSYTIGDVIRLREQEEHLSNMNSILHFRGEVVSVAGGEVAVVAIGSIPYHAIFKLDEVYKETEQ